MLRFRDFLLAEGQCEAFGFKLANPGLGAFGVTLGLYRDNGKENGNYYNGFRGLGFRVPLK